MYGRDQILLGYWFKASEDTSLAEIPAIITVVLVEAPRLCRQSRYAQRTGS